MPKPRTHIRLSQKAHNLLEEMTRKPGVYKSTILEDAFWAYIDGDHLKAADETILNRLDGIDLRLNAIERDTALNVESLGHFILYWLMRTDPLPDGERDAAHRLGQRRFQFFIEQVAQKLSSEDGISQKVFPSPVETKD